jgi:hypothetical protein
MGKKFEKRTLGFLFFLGISSFAYLVSKPGAKKDMLLVFFIKSYYASLADNVVVKMGFVKYPTRSTPNFFKTSVLFDYLLFPVTCMYYNLVTKDSNIIQSLIKVLYFSVPLTAVELWFEKKTSLVKYKKSWDWRYTFVSITASFLIVRCVIYFIRLFDKNEGMEEANLKDQTTQRIAN